jgi:N5-(cytidine 5'-diphosphoramidyl)-L-glutamine hydrolase
MKIALTQRNDLGKFKREFDSLENNYIDYIEKFGALIILIPNTTKNLKRYIEELSIEGIILTGGNDIKPKDYTKKNNHDITISDKRDETEKKLLELAIEKDIPVMGICRGMQLINIYFGGNIKELKKEDESHIGTNNKINISQEYTKDLSTLKEEKVNSFHKFGIDKLTLSEELKSFAETKEGIIEGLYHPKKRIAGVQWHPERDSFSNELNQNIVKSFLNKKIFWGKK